MLRFQFDYKIHTKSKQSHELSEYETNMLYFIRMVANLV